MKTSVVVVATILLITLGLPVTTSGQKNAEKTRYFLDVHKLEPGSVKYADVAGAHEKDLMTQDKYGVQFITYWVDEAGGNVYCLSKAEDYEDVTATHREAHGLIPAEIYEVVAGEEANYTGNGSLYLDIHDLGPGNVTSAAVAEAHVKDLKEQGSRKVNFINYWVDEKNGKVFCLAEAPSKDAVIATHKHAHGLVPVEVFLVKQGQ
jgi:hypothetical protein